MRGVADESDGRGAAGWLRAAVESLVIAAVFAAAGAWPVPDVNEAVYLTKARHAADPSWGGGDFFLETPDAHGVFYLLAGPLASRLSLESAAWIGRWLGWGALAVGFRHAAVPLLTTGWGRVLAAVLFSFVIRNTTAAGEWVIGGCEAKVFAWALVFGGLGEIGCGRFAAAIFQCGLAAAFHPIVGGWAGVATVAAWIASRMRADGPEDHPHRACGGASWKDVALVAGGVLTAAAGVVPALGLTAGVDDAIRAAATRIYVVERLSHHLLLRSFADGMVARHVLAVAVWWLLSRLIPSSAPSRRIAAFTVAALGISGVGVVISLLEPWAPSIAYALLRYYWFRLADVAVPFALATTCAAVVSDDAICRRVTGLAPAMVRWAVAAVLLVDLGGQGLHWPIPGRTGLVPRSDSKIAAAGWADICDWVRDHAPADACFLTPRGAASFTWRTGRREVVCWKNSPQDAASLVEWRRRILDCFSRSGSLMELERSTVSLGAERLQMVAEWYGADHAIVPLDAPLIESIAGELLHANGTYAVYRLSPEKAR
jgi:hypothetical protein